MMHTSKIIKMAGLGVGLSFFMMSCKKSDLPVVDGEQIQLEEAVTNSTGGAVLSSELGDPPVIHANVHTSGIAFKAGARVELFGVNLLEGLRLRVDEDEVFVTIETSSASFLLPYGPPGRVWLYQITDKATKIAELLRLPDDDSKPFFTGDLNTLCRRGSPYFFDELGHQADGNRECVNVPKSCTFDGDSDCYIAKDSPYGAVKVSELKAGDLARGVIVGGVVGQFPSNLYPLPRFKASSGTITSGEDLPDLTHFMTQVDQSANFEYWDSFGRRHSGSGDSNFVPENIRSGTTIFGKTGIMMVQQLPKVSGFLGTYQAGQQRVALTWNNMGYAGYVVVYSKDSPVVFIPTDGANYSIGRQGTDEIIYVGTGLNFMHDVANIVGIGHYRIYGFQNNSYYYSSESHSNVGINCTAGWDTAFNSSVSYSDNDHSVVGVTGTQSVRSTIGVTSGKFYWELLATQNSGGTNAGGIGIVRSSGDPSAVIQLDGAAFGFGNSLIYSNFSSNRDLGSDSKVIQGKRFMMALDMNTGKLYAGENCNWYFAANLPAGMGAVDTNISGTIHAGISFYGNVNAFTANFGQSTFACVPPAGYTCLKH